MAPTQKHSAYLWLYATLSPIGTEFRNGDCALCLQAMPFAMASRSVAVRDTGRTCLVHKDTPSCDTWVVGLGFRFLAGMVKLMAYLQRCSSPPAAARNANLQRFVQPPAIRRAVKRLGRFHRADYHSRWLYGAVLAEFEWRSGRPWPVWQMPPKRVAKLRSAMVNCCFCHSVLLLKPRCVSWIYSRHCQNLLHCQSWTDCVSSNLFGTASNPSQCRFHQNSVKRSLDASNRMKKTPMKCSRGNKCWTGSVTGNEVRSPASA